jgi:hypothetical protein
MISLDDVRGGNIQSLFKPTCSRPNGRATSHLSIERRRAQTRKACLANPPLIQRSITGGQGWARRYRSLPDAERARVVQRLVLGTYRYLAKRNGQPPPIEMTFEPLALRDGGIAAKPGSLREMTEEELAEIFTGKPEAP